MKSFRNLLLACALLALIGAGGAQGNLSRWLQTIESGSKYDAVFFKSFVLPSGSITARRPAAESRAELGKLIQAAPAEADLYSLRAMEAERQRDFAAAEADWKKHVELAPNKTAAQLALADYYHRRLQVREELAALTAAAAHERAIQLIDSQALDPSLVGEQYKAWVRTANVDRAAFPKALDDLNARKQFAAAEDVLRVYQQRYPQDSAFVTRAQADIAFARGDQAQAARIWDQAFDPLWPAATIARYFEVTGSGRNRLQSLQPSDLAQAAKIFHLQQRWNNPAAARRALEAVRAAKTSWTARDWTVLGRLFEMANAPEDAAKAYHSLYLLDHEQGLSELARLLIDMPDQPIAFGAGDLALYRDIATMDQGPGYLNGILSLVLNGEGMERSFDRQSHSARSYFHRAKASELLSLLSQQFPTAPARAPLSAKLIQAYATYGDRQGVIRAGRQFLADFAASPDRLQVAFLMADAFAATNQVNDEIALYDQMLAALEPKSPDFSRTMDRYVARLVAWKRLPQALALFRREIDRNGGEPAIYERFALFLEQNKLGADVEQLYKQALQKFNDNTWSDKLARWYLRNKQLAQFQDLTREITRTFSGAALEEYFSKVVASSSIAPALSLQLNLYASQRFPHHLTFVRNLLNYYQSREPASYEMLLRQHWFEAPDLRARFFELLSRTGRLQAELDGIRAMNPKPDENPVANELLAEGEIWRTRYEQAAQVISPEAGERAAALHRSLGQYEAAAAIERNAEPRDTAALTRLGEMEAERERFAQARLFWEKIPTIEPGKPEGVLETATLYWDYFQFNDALRTIETGRRHFQNPALAAYEAGVIRENQRDYSKAAGEYITAALAGDTRARDRLVRLAQRPGLRDSLERAVSERVTSADDLRAVMLRVALYESQNRRQELLTFLSETVARTRSLDVIAQVIATASLNGMQEAERLAMSKRIPMMADEAGRLRARLDYMRFLEGRNQTGPAREAAEQIYRDYPTTLGVIRALVNFHARHNGESRAIAILLQAADRATGTLPAAFRYEAARRSIDAKDYAMASRLMSGLLAAEPYREDYLATAADILVRQGDDAGLRNFYAKSIASLRAANRPTEALRRQLIPVLTRQKDFAGVIDQYIEILKRAPEDESTAREAARFASANRLQPRLLDYFTKAAHDSPRDYRWPLVLSRMQSELNDVEGSLASLGKATSIRPDRMDLMLARARLEERSLRFEEALLSYQKVWELSYRDPAWMEKAAEQHLRAGRADAAVAALKLAYLDNQPERPENYSRVASTLLDWNLVAAAQTLASKATLDLQARIAMRLRQPLRDAFPAEAAGEIIAEYYTPAEKAALAPALRGQRGIRIARSARMPDIEASLLAATVNQNSYEALIELQTRRARFDELGGQLEAIASNPSRAGDNRNSMLRDAALAYRQSGNVQAEMRTLSALSATGALQGGDLNRYAILLARAGQPAIALAGNENASAEVRDAIAGASVFAPRFADTAAILAAHGRQRAAVWTSAYTALAGVYLGAAQEPTVEQAFAAALGSQSIGEQLARKPDRATQLVGKNWFYYAARYGQNVPAAEDYAIADVEFSPASATLYEQLGDFHMEHAAYAKARHEYEYALQLNPRSAGAQRKIAAALYGEGQREEAIAAWRAALQGPDLRETIEDIALAKMTAELRPDIDRALRRRFRQSGGYEADVLLRPVAGPQDTAWMLELANSAPDPAQVLAALLDAEWLTAPQREALLAAAVESSDRRAANTLGELREQALQESARWHAAQVRDALARKNFAKASAALTALSVEVRSRREEEFGELAVLLAAARGQITDREAASASLETLTRIAAGLDPSSARTLLEYAYTREIEAQRASASIYLGLAKIRIEQNRLPDAVSLLRQMNNSIGEPFSTTALAADLLTAANQPGAAREFADMLEKARPWDPRAKLRAAVLKKSTPELKALAESADTPYAARCEAALAIRAISGPALRTGVPELDLLAASAPPTERQANASPYQVALRKQAARAATDANARHRLWMGVLAAEPEDEKTRREAFASAIAARRFQMATSLYRADQLQGRELALLADALLRLGRNLEAEHAAQRMVDSGAPGARKLLETARNAARLQQWNEQRMPVFQENYDQDRIVKPRLAALPAARLGGAR